MKCLLAILLLPLGILEACDHPIVPAKSQVPSHQAEFVMATADYPKLLSALDGAAASFRLKRFGAAPGLDAVKGRKVLFAGYKTDIEDWRAALDVHDLKAPGKVLLSVFVDYFDDPEQRQRFVASVEAIIQPFNGKLAPRQNRNIADG